MRRVLAVAILLAVVVGSGGYAYAQTRDRAPSYRTATAVTGDVQRTLDLSGTVSGTGRRDLSFGTAGTVRRVLVRTGQHVRKGQVLARLDPTSLDAQVTSAEASLAKARAQLASDEDAQSETVSTAATTTTKKKRKVTKTTPTTSSTTGSPTTGSPTTGSGATGGTSPVLQKALAALAQEQQAVTAAQSTVSADIGDAKDKLAAQTSACRQDSSSGDSSGEGSGSGDGSGTGDGSGSTGLSQACTDALAAVQAAQEQVSTDQDTLQEAINALGATLTQAVSALGSTAQSGQDSTGQGSTGKGSTGQGSSTPSSSGSGSSTASSAGRTVTAATLAQDQAQIDTAKASLGEAQAARALATLRAPYAGQIVSSSIASNDLVSASTTAFVLVGRGVTEVSATLSSAQVAEVHRGQQVSVTPAGATSSLTGTVGQVGLLADSSGNHTLTVTVQGARHVAEGTTASLAIVVGTARQAVTVPTSAVTRLGTRAVVQVLRGTTVTRTIVTVGVVGLVRTSISNGLKAGATIVIADLDASLPSSDSTSNNRRSFGGGGGFGGGSGFGGGGAGPVVVQRGG